MLLKDRVVLIRKAGQERKLLLFVYKDLAGRLSNRKVEPYSWKVKGETLYLYSHCRAKDETRLFQVHRMLDVKISDEYFLPKHAVELGDIPGSGI